jgi:hypothetical protein
MRDSNSRGVATNTLSKSVAGCPASAETVCNQARRDRADGLGRRRTPANETEIETDGSPLD